MIYLSDNDIVEKLAILDLLDDALIAFNAPRSAVFVIPTLKYRFGGRTRAKEEGRLGVAVVARILEFVAGVQEIRDDSADDQLSLDDLVGIDHGEAVLLSATAAIPDFRLLTGDKRCLRAVATHPECSIIAHRIRGRVVCLEQILRLLITRFGFFGQVLDRVVPVSPSCDTAVRSAFGSGARATEPNAVACLDRYIRELRDLPIDLLDVDLWPVARD